MTKHSIYLVATDYVPATRAHIYPFLERGAKLLDDGRDAEDLMEALSDGRQQLWMISDGEKLVAICITEITKNVCLFFLMIGNGRKNWLHLITEVESWAKKVGCDKMRAIARPGWARVLKDYRKTRIVLEKRI